MAITNIETIILGVIASSILIYLFTRMNKSLGAYLTILVTLLTFFLVTYYGYNGQLQTTVNYLPLVTFKVTNIGIFFAITVTFVIAMASFFNPFHVEKYKYPALYNMFYVLLSGLALGIFFASDFITLFLMFELLVWTSMFLIPLGKSRSAAVMYFVFSTIGSFALLIAIFMMYNITGTFDIDAALAGVSGPQAVWVFILMMIAAFAKLGAFPLHVWLPVAHGNAPHPFSPVLSGALVKLGAFVGIMALVRISPVSGMFNEIGLPIAQYIIAILGSISIVVGTLMAIREDDAKRLIAYSSVSHGGYILVAFSLMNSIAFSGGFYHILAHALASAAAFMAIGVVAKQTGTTKMSELGGIIHKMPVTYLVYLIAIISIAGIPPMGGFISKWLIYQAVINKGMVLVSVAVFFGSIGSFLYVFRPLAALFLGQEFKRYDHIKEANAIEMTPMLILSMLIIYTGVFPNFILGFINKIIADFGYAPVVLTNNYLTGFNGDLHPALISLVFGVGVFVIFILFMIFPKSRKVELMDTYTAANFIYNEELYHYSTDFYAPFERLYAKHPSVEKFYEKVINKIKELGDFVVYLFFGRKPETAVIWIVVILILVLWGGQLW